MVTRPVAVASIAVTGLGFVAGAVASYARLDDPGLVASGLVGLGVVLGIGIVAGGGYPWSRDVAAAHALRIAGWNALGVVLLGGTLLVATVVPDGSGRRRSHVGA